MNAQPRSMDGTKTPAPRPVESPTAGDARLCKRHPGCHECRRIGLKGRRDPSGPTRRCHLTNPYEQRHEQLHFTDAALSREDFDESGSGPTAAGQRSVELSVARAERSDACSVATGPDGRMFEQRLECETRDAVWSRESHGSNALADGNEKNDSRCRIGCRCHCRCATQGARLRKPAASLTSTGTLKTPQTRSRRCSGSLHRHLVVTI